MAQKILLYENFSYLIAQVAEDTISLPSYVDLTSLFVTSDTEISYTIRNNGDGREEPLGLKATVTKGDKVYTGTIDKVDSSSVWLKNTEGLHIIRNFDELTCTSGTDTILSLSSPGTVGYKINGLWWYPKYSCILDGNLVHLSLESVVVNNTDGDFSSDNLCMALGSVSSTHTRSLSSSEGPTFLCHPMIQGDRKILPHTTSSSTIVIPDIVVSKAYVYYCNSSDVLFGINFIPGTRLPPGSFTMYDGDTMNPIGISYLKGSKESELTELLFGNVATVSCSTEQLWDNKVTKVTVSFDRSAGEDDFILMIKYPYYGKLSSFTPGEGVAKDNCITWNLGNRDNSGNKGSFSFSVTMTE